MSDFTYRLALRTFRGGQIKNHPVSECDEYIQIFEYIFHKYLFGHLFVSIFRQMKKTMTHSTHPNSPNSPQLTKLTHLNKLTHFSPTYPTQQTQPNHLNSPQLTSTQTRIAWSLRETNLQFQYSKKFCIGENACKISPPPSSNKPRSVISVTMRVISWHCG